MSAIGFRALARRSPARSLTVLGDLAQATAPGAQASWDDVIAHLGSPATARRTDLDLGYRVPAAIVDVANRLLAEAAPDVVPCRSVRLDGRPPRVVPVDPAAGPHELRVVVARIAAELADRYTSVAVVATEPLRSSVGVVTASVLAPPDAKGLEFDAVAVVEPDAIAAGTTRGLRLLYVALTRAVQELVIVHARPLPPGLVSEPTRGGMTSPRWGAPRRGT